MKKWVKYAILLCVGGSLYCGLELLFRSETHWTMYFVGGVCFVLVGLINYVLPWRVPMLLQMLMGGALITAVEFVSGCILNILMGLNIWDYSDMSYNVLGQICLPFSGLWCLLSLPAIVLDDYLRYWLFGEEKPIYYALLRWQHD